MKTRIKYSKTGPVKFISHLDVMRYFQKAIRRAELDISYSTGMSPYCVPVEWEYESCENYQDIAIEGEVTPAGNVISWLGGQPGPNR